MAPPAARNRSALPCLPPQIPRHVPALCASSSDVTHSYYEAADGSDGFPASGAYIFRPKSSNPKPVCPGKVTVTVVQGAVVTEVRAKEALAPA